MRFSAMLTISLAFLLSSCSKENTSSNDDTDFLKSAVNEEVDLLLKGAGVFEKVITNPLVKIDGCRFIVAGTIEFLKDGELEATIDFGDGECDNIATKTVDGETIEFELKKKRHQHKPGYELTKVIVEPIVKIEGCDYIVSGVIEFYKEDTWIVTIDFGDGECDEWATKTWDGGSKEFSMEDWKWREKN